MTEEKLSDEIRSWKVKIQRVANGYVRVTCHGDTADEAITTWSQVHDMLAKLGEQVEEAPQ